MTLDELRRIRDKIVRKKLLIEQAIDQERAALKHVAKKLTHKESMCAKFVLENLK